MPGSRAGRKWKKVQEMGGKMRFHINLYFMKEHSNYHEYPEILSSNVKILQTKILISFMNRMQLC